MKIAPADAAALAERARTGYPLEVCGVLLGRPGPWRDGRGALVLHCRAFPNREVAAPRARFEIAPEDLLEAQREAIAAGLEIVGYYHSHPDHPARPSETDRGQAAQGLSDGVLHVVIATDGRTAEATAWTFREASLAFVPEPFDVE